MNCTVRSTRLSPVHGLVKSRRAESALSCRALDKPSTSVAGVIATTYFAALANLPAGAEELVDFGKGGNADPKSYFTVLALFLLSVPGAFHDWPQLQQDVRLACTDTYGRFRITQRLACAIAPVTFSTVAGPHAWPTTRRALRVMCSRLLGLYSQVKRSPKAKIKRKTFEMPGPAADEPVSMDSWYVLRRRGRVRVCYTGLDEYI